jgi:FkbM family methyltransferase
MKSFDVSNEYRFLKRTLKVEGCLKYFDVLRDSLDQVFAELQDSDPASFCVDDEANLSISLHGFPQGKVSNINLFGPHELTIFAVYEYWLESWSSEGDNNRSVPPVFLDLGANVGIHSILMSKRGCDCYCVEPIPNVIQCLRENSGLNSTELNIIEGAIVPNGHVGERVDFLQVLDNFTASTTVLTGKMVYGKVLNYSVPALTIEPIISLIPKDITKLIIKVDIEGAEADLLTCLFEVLKEKNFDAVRLVVEVSNEASRATIFQLIGLWRSTLRVFSDKTGFGREVSCIEDLPMNWREGSAYFEMDLTSR